jgi:hypothetical protein
MFFATNVQGTPFVQQNWLLANPQPWLLRTATPRFSIPLCSQSDWCYMNFLLMSVESLADKMCFLVFSPFLQDWNNFLNLTKATIG